MDYPVSFLKKCAATPEFINNTPSLDQLVELCKSIPKFKEISDLKLISKMRISISNQCCDKYLNHQTIYDFFLLFYMDEKYGKNWYEGANEWK